VVGLNPIEAASALAGPVGLLGGWFMASRSTYAYGSELGFEGMTFYYLGRGGAMGDVRPEVVASAMTFFPSPLVETMWQAGKAVMSPQAALEAFSEACWRWGRKRFCAVTGLERTTQLLARVADSADAASLPLFAGWRAAPRPADLPALASHLLQVLREHRGGVHGLAVLASGLTPLEACAASATDFYQPQSVGWADPRPAHCGRGADRPHGGARARRPGVR
jgi:Helix-turn-helix family